MKWAPMFFSQSFPTPSAGEFWTFLICILFVAGMIGLFYKIKADKKRSEESDEPKRRLLPNPLVTKPADEFVTAGTFREQVSRRDLDLREMETRIEKRIDEHEKIVRSRLNEINNKVSEVSTAAKDNQELATEQFQNIEGRLGELKSDVKHVNQQQLANSDKLDRLTETLPEKIAVAIERNQRRR